MSNVRTRTAATFMVQALVVLSGELINTLAFRSLIVPAKLLSGGVVGTAMLLNQLFNLPIGLQTLIYNIPIFLVGYRYLGRRFVLLSLVGVGSFSILLDNINVPILTSDLLLVAIFGGVITGIADGIIIRTGGSTGGLDIIGLLVSRRFGIGIGQVFLVFNGMIIALSALFNHKPELAMYTLIMQFVAARVIDVVQSRTPRRFALIISQRHEELANCIMRDLHRGVTYLQGIGAYTSTEFRVLMCVMTRYELVELRRIVREIDPTAFMVVLDAMDVVGNFDSKSSLQRWFH
ncbi:MAG: YitT family protein [Anaerolineae bacterium]|nr:YitT family protein [Anaerolineae bacterium]